MPGDGRTARFLASSQPLDRRECTDCRGSNEKREAAGKMHMPHALRDNDSATR